MRLIENITGVILAGGKSHRMGTDKAFLPYGENKEPLIQTVIHKITAIFSRTILSVANEKLFTQFDLPFVVDRYSAIGPIGGIASALENGEERIFCVACDMPFLDSALIHYQCSFSEDAVIPVWHGRWESLHSIYSFPVLPALRDAIGNGNYKISDALEGCKIRKIEESEIKKFNPEGKSFANMNTPADYVNLRGW
jgi:molybdopterin-guanine dinucleotide biosynthesis protein A